MITIDFQRIPPVPGRRILDIGCGLGRHTARAAEHRGTFCVAADRSHDDLTAARTQLDQHRRMVPGPGGQYVLAQVDIVHLPFKDHVFDLVICAEVMEHIPRESDALDQLIRVTRPGGILALSVPRSGPERLCWKLSKPYRCTPGGHIRIYRRGDLVRQITARGMHFTGHHHAHALHTVYWWLKCLFGIHRTDAFLVNRWHDLLVWDMMKKPALTRQVEKWLNPLMGKSVVLYFQKPFPTDRTP